MAKRKKRKNIKNKTPKKGAAIFMPHEATPADNPPSENPPTESAADFYDWTVPFLQRLAETGNVTESIRHARTNRTAVYKLRDADADFAAAWKDALEMACDALELEARRRATVGTRRLQFQSGVACIDPETGKPYVENQYSDTLLIFLLKAHRPDKFREQFKVSHGGDADAPPIRLQPLPPTIDDAIAEVNDIMAKLRARGANLAPRPTPSEN